MHEGFGVAGLCGEGGEVEFLELGGEGFAFFAGGGGGCGGGDGGADVVV